jgi:HEAT repeat protein
MVGPDDSATTTAERSRWYQVSLRGMLVAVVCCAVLVFVGELLWEYRHPAIGHARLLHRSRKPEAREEAARALAKAPVEDQDRATSALIGALQDGDPGVRAEAAHALRMLMVASKSIAARDDVRDGLIAALDDPAPQVRTVVVNALGDFRGNPDPILVPMLRHLEDDDTLVGTFCDQILAGGQLRILNPAVVPDLVKALKSPARPLRYRAAELISRIGPKASEAVPGLVAMLGQPAEQGPPHRRRTRPTGEPIPPDSSSMAAYALGRIAPGTPRAKEAMAGLEQTLRTDDVPGRRAEAARALARFGPAAVGTVPALLVALKKAGERPRTQTPDSPPAILSVVTGTADDWVATAEALGKLGPASSSSSGVIAALTDCIQRERDLDRRSFAAYILPKFGPAAKPAVPALIAALRECLKSDTWEGNQFAQTLGVVAPGTESAADAVAVLTDALDVKQGALAASACDALPRFGPAAKSAIVKLRTLQSNPDALIRDQAAKAIDAIEASR